MTVGAGHAVNRQRNTSLDHASAHSRPVPPHRGGSQGVPAPRPQTTLCPYCGHVSAGVKSCERCRGLFEPLSRQASQNAMGPWFIRDENNPFLPGFSLATLVQLVRRGRIAPDTVIKGPTTRQFWSYARNVPGVAHLLGACHVCRAPARAGDTRCGACGASFEAPDDREHLGLAPIRLLPGQADAAEVAGARNANGGAPIAGAVGSADVELDAESLIALRQRRQRARRRTTTGIVVIGIGAVLLAVTAMLVLPSLQRQDHAGASTSPAATSAPAASPQGRSGGTPAKAEPPSDRTTDGDAEPAPSGPGAGAPHELGTLIARLLTAKVDDLGALLSEADRELDRSDAPDPRLRAAAEAARTRLAAVRAGGRL
jgi:hypothetical protein